MLSKSSILDLICLVRNRTMGFLKQNAYQDLLNAEVCKIQYPI